MTAGPAAAATGTDIVALANDNYGKHCCDTNSLGGRGFGSSCTPERWCSDFAKGVWQNVGIDVAGLTPESGSFCTYGSNHGTLHTSAGHVGATIAGQTVNAFVTASGLVPPPPPKVLTRRIGVLQGDHLKVKEGGLRTEWAEETDGVSDFRLVGNRIGILRNNGTVAVKEGGLKAEWAEEAEGASQVRLTEYWH